MKPVPTVSSAAPPSKTSAPAPRSTVTSRSDARAVGVDDVVAVARGDLEVRGRAPVAQIRSSPASASTVVAVPVTMTSRPSVPVSVGPVPTIVATSPRQVSAAALAEYAGVSGPGRAARRPSVSSYACVFPRCRRAWRVSARRSGCARRGRCRARSHRRQGPCPCGRLIRVVAVPPRRRCGVDGATDGVLAGAAVDAHARLAPLLAQRVVPDVEDVVVAAASLDHAEPARSDCEAVAPDEPTSRTRWATPKSIRGEMPKVVTTRPPTRTSPALPSIAMLRPGAVTLIQPEDRLATVEPTVAGRGSRARCCSRRSRRPGLPPRCPRSPPRPGPPSRPRGRCRPRSESDHVGVVVVALGDDGVVARAGVDLDDVAEQVALHRRDADQVVAVAGLHRPRAAGHDDVVARGADHAALGGADDGGGHALAGLAGPLCRGWRPASG